jgi:hypothetical protein
MKAITKTVLFVCEHGALRSRIAAAYFNATAPMGWCAASAGREPQPHPSAQLAPLLAGTSAAAHLESGPPRPLAAFTAPDRMIAIDCAVPGADRWTLKAARGDELRDEIRARIRVLERQLTDHVGIGGRGRS